MFSVCLDVFVSMVIAFVTKEMKTVFLGRHLPYSNPDVVEPDVCFNGNSEGKIRSV